ncbi:E3 ubiquitin-protein ligase TRIM39-like isoform X1 [Amblyraja radiata]|uniref:E3 ubiquitin-protein ligase TRIM39-like isoform X1 n=1 Tax=Amblyraja radiata TaxID=386614 RepID=UPI0014041D71|nr:E3 ubiquitin-protein ligase TRIM39-like isoform X1 [Amblyraja radiata]
MASKEQVENLTEEAICPICLDFFTEPVSLECGHYFCRSCITQSWDREEKNSCPECREVFTDRSLRVSRALARLSEKVRTLSLNTEEKESKHHCEEHQEELKLFCETDKKLICVICAVGREHRKHRFMQIDEAVEIYKDQVKSSIQSLTTNKSAIQEMEEQQKQKISQVREQSQSLKSHVTSQFAELHQILVKKEQHILGEIKEEEEKILSPMEKNLQDIRENLNTIEEELSNLQGRMEQTDIVLFLKEEAGRKRDRKRVRNTGTGRSLPDTGKRFTEYACVLGSEGFTSGRHYWEVEVAENQRWILGVAAESLERKKQFTQAPETGVWSIWRGGDEFDAVTSPESPLPARPIPGRVGVYLSYESGTVSFYDAATKSHLHTFTGNKFTEKLSPLFWAGTENQWMRICSGSVKGSGPGTGVRSGAQGLWGRNPMDNRSALNEWLPFNPQIPRRETPVSAEIKPGGM